MKTACTVYGIVVVGIPGAGCSIEVVIAVYIFIVMLSAKVHITAKQNSS